MQMITRKCCYQPATPSILSQAHPLQDDLAPPAVTGSHFHQSLRSLGTTEIEAWKYWSLEQGPWRVEALLPEESEP